MHLDLTLHEATLLDRQLVHRIAELDRGLARTDTHELKQAVAREIDELRSIERRLSQSRALEMPITEDDFV